MNFDFSNKSKFNDKVVKSIFNDIEQSIKSQVAKLHKAIDDDSKTFCERYDYSALLDAVSRINKEELLLSKSDKNTYYYGIGNVGVYYNGNPEIFLYMAMKAIKTNNNIVFFESDELHATNVLLKDLIRNICESHNYDIFIDNITCDNNVELVKNAEELDMFIFINKQQTYLDFCARNKTPLKIICSSYGTMDLFLDDKQLESRLMEMDDYVYNHNIDLEIYKNEDVESAVSKINIRKNNYCAVIFTSNSKDAYYFFENVNAEKVVVNCNPQKEYFFEIDDSKMTLTKRIVY